ncbi:pyroglutamyl-peptidase I family protein [Lyngbya aestuarii]|uniref:pyroglutamyl-peptidase I family protein n=1 Tax=Lyngbya aestuarii TaxID=118322 RepID=UPI00403E1094
MNTKILLTSFDTWLPHQVSNSSDDLLEEIVQFNSGSFSLIFLRKLTVDILEASTKVISTIEELQPDIIICCGMAEKRSNLTVESCATCQDSLLTTTVDLEGLVAGLAQTKISHDTGKFVCEGLYFQVLKYLVEYHHNKCCIFVHVPVLTSANLACIQSDFQLIIERLAAFHQINSDNFR